MALLLFDLSLQVELQHLSQKLNQQIQVYTKKGFQIKDISSGMTLGSGKALSVTNPNSLTVDVKLLVSHSLSIILYMSRAMLHPSELSCLSKSLQALCCCIGAESKMYILYVTVLLSARLQAVHDTAKLDLLQNVSGSGNQQVRVYLNSLPLNKEASILRCLSCII